VPLITRSIRNVTVNKFRSVHCGSLGGTANVHTKSIGSERGCSTVWMCEE